MYGAMPKLGEAREPVLDPRHIADLQAPAHDGTGPRDAERERDAARSLFETAFSHAPVGMALLGLDGRWLKVNRAVCRITGYSEDELLARTLSELTHPEDLDADLAFVPRLLAGEITECQMEKRYLTRNGGQIWVLLSASLARDEHGAPEYLVCQVQDVSPRKQAEQQLREAEATARRERDHAQAIVAAMHEGYALSVEGEIRAVNEAWCQILGFAREELIGVNAPYPFWPCDRLRELEVSRDRIRAAGGGTLEATFVKGDGTKFDAELTVRAAYGDDGEVIGFVTALRDVSTRNRRQRELERLARTDSLTGMANRYVLDETLASEAGRSARGETLSLVLLDLDLFKQINDEHGHPTGVEVGRRLSGVVRAGEILARVGGEEFAWLLPDCDADGARSAAERARAAVASEPFDAIGSLTMSAGIGVASIPCAGAELYVLADRALYEAKHSGRDRTCCWAEVEQMVDQVPGSAAAAALARVGVSSVSAPTPARPRGIPSTATTNATAIAAAIPMTTVFVADAKSA